MDPNERWKSIAPATDDPGQHRAAPDSKKKRSAVPVACIPCRSGKARVGAGLLLSLNRQRLTTSSVMAHGLGASDARTMIYDVSMMLQKASLEPRE